MSCVNCCVTTVRYFQRDGTLILLKIPLDQLFNKKQEGKKAVYKTIEESRER